jgi:hypothetical protein
MGMVYVAVSMWTVVRVGVWLAIRYRLQGESNSR